MSAKIVIIIATDLNSALDTVVSAASRASRECYKEALHRSLSRNDLESWLSSGCPEHCLRVKTSAELMYIKQIASGRGMIVKVTETYDGHPLCLAIGPNNSDSIDEVTQGLYAL